MGTRKGIGRKEGSVADRIREAVIGDARRWAEENGLRPPLSASLSIGESVFKVLVDEANGRRSATCTFQRDGSRSMYELTRKG